ncbi:MAG TPA: dephospho-CoA kinase [Candidatus Omnitrophica bacterium]|nr:dephospho-CoA kinase [Candidatus Omnitrophota bacterium]
MSGKIIIGVSGEIGAGKTSFVRCLQEFGVYPVWTDDIAHDILRLETVKKKLVGYFGKDILHNGEISTKKLSAKAFRNKENWQKLVGITHPFIIKRVKNKIAIADSKYIAIDAPLLFESGLDELCNYIVWIKADLEIRKKRINRLSWQEVNNRTKYLIPAGIKEKMADFVVVNNGEKRRLMKNAQKIYSGIKSRQ